MGKLSEDGRAQLQGKKLLKEQAARPRRRALLAGLTLVALGLASPGCTERSEPPQDTRPAKSSAPAAPKTDQKASTAQDLEKQPAAPKAHAIAERVIAVIIEQFGVERDEVTLKSSFRDDLHVDDLDIVEMLMALEEEFGIEIPDEDLEKLQTVGQVIDYISRQNVKPPKEK